MDYDKKLSEMMGKSEFTPAYWAVERILELESELTQAQAELEATKKELVGVKEREKVLKKWIESNRPGHYYCEDGFYSCPKAEDGCFNEFEGDECNCGAENKNKEINELLNTKTIMETALPIKPPTETNTGDKWKK